MNTIKKLPNNLLPVTVSTLKESLQNVGKTIIPTAKGFLTCDANDLLYIKCESNYCMLYFKDDRKILTCNNIKSLSEYLPSELYYRIHRSFLVNILNIKEVVCKGEDTYVVLANDQRIPISREHRKMFSY